MSRFNKYLDEKCLGAYMSSMDNKKKEKKKKKKIEESYMFGGYNINDNILDNITIDELHTMIFSNFPSNKINENLIRKEFDKLVRDKMNDTRFVLKKIMKDLVSDLTRGK